MCKYEEKEVETWENFPLSLKRSPGKPHDVRNITSLLPSPVYVIHPVGMCLCLEGQIILSFWCRNLFQA